MRGCACRKLCFIKDNIARDVEFTRMWVVAFVAMVGRTVSEEDAFGGAILDFVAVIGAQERPAGTTKGFEKFVVRRVMKECFVWRLVG